MREHNIQNEIRLALSEGGVVLRLNSGDFWQGERVYSKEYNQYVLINLRRVAGCPKGTPDLLYFDESGIAFIECKTLHGKLREAQEKFFSMLDRYRIKHGKASSVDDAIKIVGRNNEIT